MLLLLGSKVPPSLRIFLLLLAIIDDICAVVIIAIFYTSELSNYALIMAGILIVVLIILNLLKVNKKFFYIVTGLLLWTAFLQSGVHTTIAGIIAAIFIPLKQIMALQNKLEDKESKKREKNYHSPNKTVIMKRLSNLFFNVFRALALWVFTVFTEICMISAISKLFFPSIWKYTTFLCSSGNFSISCATIR